MKFLDQLIRRKEKNYIITNIRKKRNDITTDYISKTIKENEFKLKIIPKAKLQAPDGFIGKYYQTFKEKMFVLHKHFHMMEENTFHFTLRGQQHP